MQGLRSIRAFRPDPIPEELLENLIEGCGSMSTNQSDQLEEQLFELICYMVTSARNLVSETPLYGPLRLVESVSRLVDVVRGFGVDSPRFQLIQRQIERGKHSVMESEEKFTAFLENLVMALVSMMEEQREKMDQS
jgi:hypothetical protein